MKQRGRSQRGRISRGGVGGVDAEGAESGGGGIIRGDRVRRVDEEGATAPPNPPFHRPNL